jgi:16S rRNA (cytosine967-C5)-methyltransferase
MTTFSPQTPEELSNADPAAPRACALDLVGKVLERRLPLDSLLEGEESFRALPSRDRAFVRMLVATVLRRLGQIDDLIARAQDRPDAPRPSVVTDILRLGVAQIAFMEVPDHAAVDTSVRLVAAAGLERMKGFVNAALRRIVRERQGWMDSQNTDLNIPEWLMQAWRTDYGEETAQALALASLSEAPLDLSVRDFGEIPFWAHELEAQILPGGSLRRASAAGNVVDLPGFSEGRWWVQDAAAAFPARLFGDVAGAEVIDLCAAPGGKTAQLAAMGARVVAVDRSAGRMKRVEENLARLGLADRVWTVCADATLWRPPGGAGSARFVLLDAPCTATGTIRRHPDVLRLKTPMDMGRMTGLQARLLDNALKILAPGGVLVYCTCSLQKDEGERQVDSFLATSAPVRRLPVRPEEVADQPDVLTDAGDVRFLPCQASPQGGMDGFFIARLQKL